MLQKLYIQNYAIIDELEITWGNHLNIITGETGAGKSILLGALSLILGERADSAALYSAEKKMVVEGVFAANGNKAVQRFLVQNELDNEEQLCIRREVAVNGKSRAFVNDTPVTLAQLQQLAGMLVDLHQQFDTQELSSQHFQREVIDLFAGNSALLVKYEQVYKQYTADKKQLNQLLAEQAQAQKEMDYHKFLYDELSEAAFNENELEELDGELKMLGSAEHIKSVLAQMSAALQEGDEPLAQRVKQLLQSARGIASVHPGMDAIAERLHAAQVELQDIAGELDAINDRLQYNPERMQWVGDRLATGYKLFKKHGVNSTAELLAIQQELEEKLSVVQEMDSRIAVLQKSTEQHFTETTALAVKLHEAREKQLAPFSKKVNDLLKQVGMPNARLHISLTETALGETGSDAIEFLFDANSSGRLEPLRKVASGGELSRLMLCIKNLVAGKIQLPTLIFDEIDSGISGEAARRVALIMKELAAKHQVICITHQAQIAARADVHYFVYKEIKGDRIVTGIRQLSHDERITTIAKMLSGEQPTAAALENAREMVGN
ncbi:MAG: DNA repair protein RecN [Dinghuibacter sp.]|nr:DNA repair protein RecN [Dinghuibacter sp.]